jgi:hypothetical protein
MESRSLHAVCADGAHGSDTAPVLLPSCSSHFQPNQMFQIYKTFNPIVFFLNKNNKKKRKNTMLSLLHIGLKIKALPGESVKKEK